MFKLAVIALTFSALCNFASAAGCVKPRPTQIDRSFLEGNFKIVKHQETNVFNALDKSFEFIGQPADMTSTCWESSAVLRDGSIHKATIKCEFSTNPAEQHCSLTKEEQERFPDAKGSVVVTSTDNSTYIAGVNCVTGKESYWWIASTTGAPLDAALDKKVLGEFKGLGLNIEKLAEERKSIVYIKEVNLQKGDC